VKKNPSKFTTTRSGSSIEPRGEVWDKVKEKVGTVLNGAQQGVETAEQAADIASRVSALKGAHHSGGGHHRGGGRRKGRSVSEHPIEARGHFWEKVKEKAGAVLNGAEQGVQVAEQAAEVAGRVGALKGGHGGHRSGGGHHRHRSVSDTSIEARNHFWDKAKEDASKVLNAAGEGVQLAEQAVGVAERVGALKGAHRGRSE